MVTARPILRLLGLAALLVAGAAQAALPPKYQRLAELRAILDAPEVARAFPDGEEVEQISWLSNDTYQVRSARCALVVRIVDDPKAPAMPGPRRFLVKPGKIKCGKPG